MKSLLSPGEHDRVIDLCVDTGLLGHDRDVRLQRLPEALRRTIRDTGRPTDQLEVDVGELAKERRVDGLDGPPLALWLERAGRQVRHVDGADAFGRWALLVRARVDEPPSRPAALVGVRSRDRKGGVREGLGVLIEPGRVLTAVSLVLDGEQDRVGCEVLGVDGTPHPAVPDRKRSNAGAGWGTLVLETLRPGAPTLQIGTEPLQRGAVAAVGDIAARVIEPEVLRGYDRVMELAAATRPDAPLVLGAPVIVNGAVVAVLIDAPDGGPFVRASTRDGLDALVAGAGDEQAPQAADESGALGRAIQINRESQWYRLKDLVRTEASGLIILHGDATQALHHFVDRMQRDLHNALDEPLTVKRVPYLGSGFGSPPESAEDWSLRATEQFRRGSGTIVDILKAACDESRLVVVFDAPIRPADADYDRALIADFVDREAPRLLEDVVGYHRLHIVLAVTYVAADPAFNAQLVGYEALGRGRPWTVTRLKQVKFPDWDDDVLPFLARERVSALDRLRLKEVYDELGRSGRCFDRLARAIQAVLNARAGDR